MSSLGHHGTGEMEFTMEGDNFEKVKSLGTKNFKGT